MILDNIEWQGTITDAAGNILHQTQLHGDSDQVCNSHRIMAYFINNEASQGHGLMISTVRTDPTTP